MRQTLLALFTILAASTLFVHGSNAAEKAAEKIHDVVIRATVPPSAPTVYLTGNLKALGPWKADALAMTGAGSERVARLKILQGTSFEYKFTLGSWEREGLGPSGTVMPNFQLLVDGPKQARHEIVDFKKETKAYIEDWKGSGVKGRLVYWTDVPSTHLSEKRHVSVWLPPGYDENPKQRYRVLYMSDGQNLFDPRIANTGVDWGVDEAIVKLAEAGTIDPPIVVGVWSSAQRLQEYSPWHRAPDYARFLIEELMPRVDAAFRTKKGPKNSAHMGSSMGGLLSFYLVTRHPDVFGACGCVSSHFPISDAVVASITGGDPGKADTTPYIERDIAKGLKAPKRVRYWFDYGDQGLDASYAKPHAKVRAWLLVQGLKEGRDFVMREYKGATHNEAAWRARLEDPLVFLYATGKR